MLDHTHSLSLHWKELHLKPEINSQMTLNMLEKLDLDVLSRSSRSFLLSISSLHVHLLICLLNNPIVLFWPKVRSLLISTNFEL